MKAKIIVSVFTTFVLIGCGKSSNNTKQKEPINVSKTVLSPVSNFKKDITPQAALKYRNDYRSTNFLDNDDTGTYSFLNIPEFYATGTIYRDGQVAMLEKEIYKPILETDTDTDIGKITFEELLKDPKARMQGVLIIHDGKIVFEDYMGMRKLDKHSWFSASKTLTGLVVHILEEEGLIDLEQSVSHYIPEYISEDWQKVKVKHLLHHVSGMDYVETNTNFQTPEHPLAKATVYGLATKTEPSLISTFDLMKDVTLYKEPGTAFDYSSINTQILGYIIERVTNQKFEDVLSEKVWTKTGMESEGHYAITPQGEPLIGGYFGSRLRDMGRFGMLFTPSWNIVTETPIVSDSYFTKVYDKTYSDTYLKGAQGTNNAKYFQEVPSHASYQWDAVFNDGDMYKAGRYGQGIYVSPSTNTVIVWFSSVHQNLIYFPGFSRQIIQEHFK